jgi:anti-anti-sigma regulatory factor
MLRITRSESQEVVFTISGRVEAENVPELRTLFSSEERGRRIVLDLEDLTLVDRDVVDFLERCEAESVRLESCPLYVREWIDTEREGKQSA